MISYVNVVVLLNIYLSKSKLHSLECSRVPWNAAESLGM
jgi:hypothetical protein